MISLEPNSKMVKIRTKLSPLSAFLIVILACNLILAQDQSRERLNNSPRHHEWVAIEYDNRTVHSFLVYPEISENAAAVIVIHENRGLTDWVCSVADQLAEHGYIAIAPDLLSGMAPEGGRTIDFSDGSAAREAIYQLSQEQVTDDLNAVFDHVKNLPASNGKVAVAGFCWGGKQSFLYATEQSRLEAAYVFYGTPPESNESVSRISCPVYGFYGGNDARVNASIPNISELMRNADKVYEPVVYENAGHGFMRSGEMSGADEGNKLAQKAGWQRWISLLQPLKN